MTCLYLPLSHGINLQLQEDMVWLLLRIKKRGTGISFSKVSLNILANTVESHILLTRVSISLTVGFLVIRPTTPLANAGLLWASQRAMGRAQTWEANALSLGSTDRASSLCQPLCVHYKLVIGTQSPTGEIPGKDVYGRL